MATPDGTAVTPAAEPLDTAALGRVLTLPNLLSVARLGLLAAFFVTLFADGGRVVAAALLGVAGATDFLDGYIARRFNQVSTIGKMLDPTVDRLVVAGAVVASVVYGAVPLWLAAAVLVRELLTSTMMLVVATLAGRRIDVVFVGKAATFGLMCAIPLLVASYGPGSGWHVVRVVGWVMAIAAFALSCVATASYLPTARRALAGRSGSAGGAA